MRRIIINISIAILVVILSIVLGSLLSPLRRSDERIKADMLKLTPIGMSMEDAKAIIENNDKWKVRHILDGGYTYSAGVPIGPHQGGDSLPGVRVGVTTMEVDIGFYNFFVFIFKEEISIFYGFDEDSKLVDIAVRRYAMGT